MARVGRNEPCPCGSGRKAKRCCGIERGPSQESLARAFLSNAARDSAKLLASLSDDQFERLLDDLWELPCADLSLQAQLPKLLCPELSRLAEAVVGNEPDRWLLEAATEKIDTALERERLARAVIAKADGAVIDRQLAAAALLDLASGSRIFLGAALLEAIAVKVGAARTPAGMLLAA